MDPVNVECIRVVARKHREWEAPYKAAGEPTGLGIGATALLLENAADELEQLRAEIERLRVRNALYRQLVIDAPILVINARAAAARNEKEALRYASAVKEWHARTREVLDTDPEQSVANKEG